MILVIGMIFLIIGCGELPELTKPSCTCHLTDGRWLSVEPMSVHPNLCPTQRGVQYRGCGWEQVLPSTYIMSIPEFREQAEISFNKTYKQKLYL